MLSCRYQRVVARDNTVRLGARLIQIPRGPHGRSYASRRVEVRELRDGRVVVLADHVVIATVPTPDAARPPRLTTALAQLAAALPQSPRKPHPWRRGYDPLAALKAGYPGRGLWTSDSHPT